MDAGRSPPKSRRAGMPAVLVCVLAASRIGLEAVSPVNGPSSIDLEWLKRHFRELADLQPLAAGGYKQVIAGRHPADGEVVLKLIRPGVNPEEIRRERSSPCNACVPHACRASLLTGLCRASSGR